MTSNLIDPSPIEDLARGESRERLIDIGHDVPADLKDVSEINPETLAMELGRLTGMLDDEYRRVAEADSGAEAEQAELFPDSSPKVAKAKPAKKGTVPKNGKQKRKPKGSREKAWADMGESVRRKPPAYWDD